jgi:pre-mycofactocin synthase
VRRSAWFESVAEAERRARRRLPQPVYSALVAGSEAGVTSSDNVLAFQELGFAPGVADAPHQRLQGTVVMGLPSSMPVVISPVGVQAVHPDGEIAVARAAASRGVPMGLSAFASKSIEEVADAQPSTLMQIFWSGGRDVVLRRLDRARAAGAAGLIVTLDWSFSHGRDRGSPHIPERLTGKELLRFAPHALRRPGWLAAWLRAGGAPDLTVPNMSSADSANPTFFEAYADWMSTPPPTWEDLAWLRQRWDGPLMLKGITRVEDARRACAIGATAISVSNHGGNNLDTTPGTIRLLPAITEAVGDEIEVLLDGGIRRGSDVVKAVALGARAVLVGRAHLWGLAAAGQAGVENVLDILRGGIDSALLGLARSSVSELSREDVLVPARFFEPVGNHNQLAPG